MIVIDLDATDDPLHGAQEGRFLHGYYREYCYLRYISSVAIFCLSNDRILKWVSLKC